MTPWNIMLPFLTSGVIVYLSARLLVNYAHHWGLTARKTKRSPDKREMLIGGVSLFIGSCITILPLLGFNSFTISLFTGGLLITLTGFLDDLYLIPAKFKLIIQILICLIPISFGIIPESLSFLNFSIHLGIWRFPFALFWFLAVTNAINLIDGLDGLAVGGCFITALTIALIAWDLKNLEVLTVSISLVGVCLAFLPFNYHRAKLYLGDGGSYFLGFTLALLTVIYSGETVGDTKNFPLLVSFLLFFLPLVDTFWAIIRRTRKGVSLFRADRAHIHHKLLYRVGNYRLSVSLLHVVWLIFCIFGYLIYFY